MTKRTKTTQERIDNLSPEKKRAYLHKLPEHKQADVRYTQHNLKGWDIGTRRPWDTGSIKFLADAVQEGMQPIDIAWMTRRDPDDVFATVQIYRFMVQEMEQVELARIGLLDITERVMGR